MDRLHVLDAEFLHLEDGIAHMHIGGVCVFDGPAPAIDDFTAALAGKLHLIPRYRQRVQTVPLELGRPVWVDDPDFNLEYHIRHAALPPPGNDEQLCRLVGRLMSQPLDRARPLWELWVVEGLPDGQWAFISKVHHCMVDGISGVDLLSVVLDLDPDVEILTPEPWQPEPAPSGPARVLDAWSGLAGDLASIAGQMPGAARNPLRALRSACRDVQGALRLTARLRTTDDLSIEGRIGPHRRWCHAEASLDDVRTIRRAFGGTVNDVVLAACAAGYRALLESRGEDPDRARVRTLVPVSVRTAEAQGVFDNRVSAILFDLPVHLADPVGRLRAARDQMGTLKTSHMADAGEALTTLGDLAPPVVVGGLSRAAVRVMHQLPQRSVNTVTTNVPGPQVPLYSLGREMRAYYPYVPISHGVRVGTAILSYNGQLSFGVTGDFDTAPDIAVLADAIAAEIRRLAAMAVSIDVVEAKGSA